MCIAQYKMTVMNVFPGSHDLHSQQEEAQIYVFIL